MRWEHIRHLLGRMDWAMVFAVAALLAAGIAFIFSASYRGDNLPVAPFYQKQMVWAVVGTACLFGVMLGDYRRLRDASWWLYALSLALLVAVLLIGKKVYGAYRWLNLFGIQVQPSEFGKLATLIVLARFLSRPGRDLEDPRTVIQTLLIAAVPFVLIFKEPDLGSAAMLLPLAFLMMFAAGVPLRHLLILVGIAALLLPLSWFVLGEYQKDRILVFLRPDRDPLGAGWNKIQSEIAVGSGGFSG
jgi:rod shape determining protein RodA